MIAYLILSRGRVTFRGASELQIEPRANLPVGNLLTVFIDRVLRLDEQVGGDLAHLHHLAGAEADRDKAEVVLKIEVPDCARAQIEAVRQIIEDDGWTVSRLVGSRPKSSANEC